MFLIEDNVTGTLFCNFERVYLQSLKYSTALVNDIFGSSIDIRLPDRKIRLGNALVGALRCQ